MNNKGMCKNCGATLSNTICEYCGSNNICGYCRSTNIYEYWGVNYTSNIQILGMENDKKIPTHFNLLITYNGSRYILGRLTVEEIISVMSGVQEYLVKENVCYFRFNCRIQNLTEYDSAGIRINNLLSLNEGLEILKDFDDALNLSKHLSKHEYLFTGLIAIAKDSQGYYTEVPNYMKERMN